MPHSDPFAAPSPLRRSLLQLEMAPWWRRGVARIVDGLGLGLVLLAWLELMPLFWPDAWRGAPHVGDMLRFAAPAAVLTLVILGLHTGLLVARGYTPGQWLVAIRVVQSREGMPDAVRVLAREGSLWLLVAVGPVGWLIVGLDVVVGVMSGRSLRDRATGTQCVGDG